MLMTITAKGHEGNRSISQLPKSLNTPGYRRNQQGEHKDDKQVIFHLKDACSFNFFPLAVAFTQAECFHTYGSKQGGKQTGTELSAASWAEFESQLGHHISAPQVCIQGHVFKH